jgi:hypothetical protein
VNRSRDRVTCLCIVTYVLVNRFTARREKRCFWRGERSADCRGRDWGDWRWPGTGRGSQGHSGGLERPRSGHSGRVRKGAVDHVVDGVVWPGDKERIARAVGWSECGGLEGAGLDGSNRVVLRWRRFVNPAVTGMDWKVHVTFCRPWSDFSSKTSSRMMHLVAFVAIVRIPYGIGGGLVGRGSGLSGGLPSHFWAVHGTMGWIDVGVKPTATHDVPCN